jgi:hypothetical protein
VDEYYQYRRQHIFRVIYDRIPPPKKSAENHFPRKKLRKNEASDLLKVVFKEEDEIVEGDAGRGEAADEDGPVEEVSGIGHRFRRVAADAADDAGLGVDKVSVRLDDLG